MAYLQDGHQQVSSNYLSPWVSCEIIKEEWAEIDDAGKEEETIPLEKKFITSPAEVNTHRKMQLQNAEIAQKYKAQFKQLRKEFEDIFSKD